MMLSKEQYIRALALECAVQAIQSPHFMQSPDGYPTRIDDQGIRNLADRMADYIQFGSDGS